MKRLGGIWAYFWISFAGHAVIAWICQVYSFWNAINFQFENAARAQLVIVVIGVGTIATYFLYGWLDRQFRKLDQWLAGKPST